MALGQFSIGRDRSDNPDMVPRVWLATFLSLLVPGLGHIYAGSVVAGVTAFLGLPLVTVASMILDLLLKPEVVGVLSLSLPTYWIAVAFSANRVAVQRPSEGLASDLGRVAQGERPTRLGRMMAVLLVNAALVYFPFFFKFTETICQVTSDDVELPLGTLRIDGGIAQREPPQEPYDLDVWVWSEDSLAAVRLYDVRLESSSADVRPLEPKADSGATGEGASHFYGLSWAGALGRSPRGSVSGRGGVLRKDGEEVPFSFTVALERSCRHERDSFFGHMVSGL